MERESRDLHRVFTGGSVNESKPKKRPKVAATVAEFITFMQAAHVSQDTDWELEARGGIFMVSFPEQLKTTILIKALKRYPEVLLVSDMNVREFSDLREDLLISRNATICFLFFLF